MAVQYRFKPYAPTKLKKKKVAGVDDVDKTIKSLEKQRENLDERLRAEGIDPETLGGEFDNRNLIEKALNLPANQGLLMDFFEVINRPVEAVKSMLTAGSRGDDALTGFAEGLAGKQTMTGAEFNKQFLGFEAETKLGKFLLNIGTDIAFDPLTYLPPGIIAKGLSKLGGIGSKKFTREVVEAATKSAVKQAADDFGKTIASRAQALVDDVARADITDIDDAVLEVIKTSGDATSNVRNVHLIDDALDTMSVQDIAKGIKDGSLNETLLTKSSKTKILKDRIVRMSEIVDGTYQTAKPGEAAEIRKYLKIYEKIEGLDPENVLVVLNKASDRFDDIAIMYRTKIGNRAALVKVDSIEIKQMTETLLKKGGKAKSKAFFSNLTMGSKLDAGTGLKTIAFGEMTSLSKEGQEIMRTAFRKIKTSITVPGRTEAITLDELMARAADAFSAKKTTLFKKYKKEINKILKLDDAANKEILRGMYIDLAKESKIGFTFLETGLDGSGVMVDVANNIEKFAETFQVMESAAGKANAAGKKLKQFRFRTGFSIDDSIDLAQFADETDTLLQRFVQQPGSTKEVTEIWTLARQAREGKFGELAQKIAVSYKNFETKFKLTFNLTAGFSPETKALLMKAQGADMFDLERRSGVLADIKKKLIDVDPDAGKLLGELIEADAKIINGTVQKLKRQIGTSDMFDYMYSLITKGDGGRMAIPAFANADAERKFLEKINDIYKNATGSTDIMFTVKKGKSGSQVLAFAGDASEMKDLIRYIKDAPLMNRRIPDYLNFGEKALSPKAVQFLKNNVEEIDRYRKLTDELLDDLVNVAGFKNLPEELQGQIGYMRHTMTKEAIEGLKKQMPGVLSIYTTPGGRTLGKRNIMGSTQEINAVMRDFFDISDDFFDPNAFNAMEDFITQVSRKMDQKQILDIILTNKGVDGSDLFKVVDNTQLVKSKMSPYDVMIKDFREDFKTLYENLAPEAKEVFDAFLVKNGYDASKAIQLNKSAFNVLKGVEKAYFDVPELAKIYDKFLNTWKGLTLITPGFHMRNLFGNMFNSYAVGMDTLAQGKYLGKSMQELTAFQDIGKKLAQGADLTGAERKIYDTVRGYFEQGVSQTHRGIRDLEGVMEASAKQSAKGGFKNTYNNVVRFNFNIAEKSDDIQRYALYRWSLDKTGDSVKAANTVAEALFDYSHLTPFEKSYMKRLFPFYTFMKNNFVFQMKNIFKNPAQYAKLGRAYKYAVEDLGGYSIDDMPDYATENMWLPLPWTVDKNDKDAVAFLKATLPASDFTELVENPFKKGVTSLTAPIKLMIEFGAGKDLFTGQPLEAFPGQKSAMPEGTGVLSGLRDRRGNLTISQSPLFIKIMNDLGLRAPINIASAGLDVVDTLAGYQGTPENLGDFLQRAGIAGVSEMDRLKLSKLYQDLEKLRELKKFYEQETGNQLPVLPRG